MILEGGSYRPPMPLPFSERGLSRVGAARDDVVMQKRITPITEARAGERPLRCGESGDWSPTM